MDNGLGPKHPPAYEGMVNLDPVGLLTHVLLQGNVLSYPILEFQSEFSYFLK